VFADIPPRVVDVMSHLEQRDHRDRLDGTPRLSRLRQIPPETGRFLAILAASAPEGEAIEIGTSAGYSALWLSLASAQTGRTLRTFEVLSDKAQLARATFDEAGVSDRVNLVHGDFLEHANEVGPIGFCFLDAEKDVYVACYEAIVSRLVNGGLLIADNVISHAEELRPFVERALGDPRVDAVVVPIGKGELVCRRNASN
jgi:caffeoyl-CoA O-methyltransferase